MVQRAACAMWLGLTWCTSTAHTPAAASVCWRPAMIRTDRRRRALLAWPMRPSTQIFLRGKEGKRSADDNTSTCWLFGAGSRIDGTGAVCEGVDRQKVASGMRPNQGAARPCAVLDARSSLADAGTWQGRHGLSALTVPSIANITVSCSVPERGRELWGPPPSPAPSQHSGGLSRGMTRAAHRQQTNNGQAPRLLGSGCCHLMAGLLSQCRLLAVCLRRWCP